MNFAQTSALFYFASYRTTVVHAIQLNTSVISYDFLIHLAHRPMSILFQVRFKVLANMLGPSSTTSSTSWGILGNKNPSFFQFDSPKMWECLYLRIQHSYPNDYVLKLGSFGYASQF